MSTNLPASDITLPVENDDIEILINTLLYYLKSNKEAQSISRQNMEQKFHRMSDEIKKMFMENGNSIKSLSKDISSLAISFSKGFGNIVGSVRKESGSTTKRISALEEKMSEFGVLVDSVNKKLDLIVDRLLPSNLTLSGGKPSDKGSKNSDEHMSVIKTETQGVKNDVGDMAKGDCGKNSDSSAGVKNYLPSDSGSCDEYFPFNSDGAPYVEIKDIGSDNEDCYDVSDRVEREYTVNSAPVEDIERGAIYVDGVEVSFPGEENPFSEERPASLYSSCSSDDEESFVGEVIEPVEDFSFKVSRTNDGESLSKGQKVIERSTKSLKISSKGDCFSESQPKESGIPNDGHQQKSLGSQDGAKKQNGGGGFNVCYSSKVPCSLFHLDKHSAEFDSMGEGKWEIVSDATNGRYKLLFGEIKSDRVLFSVELNEKVVFREVDGSPHIMLKHVADDCGLQMVDNHCIEFSNEAEARNFVVSLNSIYDYFV
uniref:PH domain-containing protein n=1 Tax=Strongyloides venezuelensis TaxID=75913 RepID=A0A0K0F7P9_STRVS